MANLRFKKSTLLWLLVLAISAMAVLVPVSPAIRTPNVDSSVFLYAGRVINQGGTAYRDAWENKPPMIFYTDALGLALGGSTWGVWALEVVSLVSTCWLAFFFLRRFFPVWAAVAGLLVFLPNLVFFLEGGNMTEEFALPFQFAALLLFAIAEKERHYGWRGWAIGVAVGLAFMFKQTTVGIGVSIGLYLLISFIADRDRRRLWTLLAITGGALVVVLSWALYFAFRGALLDFWGAAFLFNFLYAGATLSQRLTAIWNGIISFSAISLFFQVGLLAWFVALVYYFSHEPRALRLAANRRWGYLAVGAAGMLLLWPVFSSRQIGVVRVALFLVLASAAWIYLSGRLQRFRRTETKDNHQPGARVFLLPVVIALLDTPIELALVSTSVRNFQHYYLTLMPALIILTAFFLASLSAWVENPAGKRVMGALRMLLMVSLMYNGISQSIRELARPIDHSEQAIEDVVEYVVKTTSAEDRLVVWGFNADVLWQANRSAPSRFIHHYPFYNGYNGSSAVFEIYLADLAANPPAMILDPLKDFPFLAIDSQGNCGWDSSRQPAGIDPILAYFCSHYRFAGTVGADQWRVYLPTQTN